VFDFIKRKKKMTKRFLHPADALAVPQLARPYRAGQPVPTPQHLVWLLALLGILGCQTQPTAAVPDAPVSNVSYLLANEPTDGVPVGTARRTAADGQALTLVGYIGGSTTPFVPGAAVFTLVDPAVPQCADPGDPTPWAYCCQQEALKTNLATVQFMDHAGEILYHDAKPWLGIKELDLVMVQGTAKRDEAGNLILWAEKLYVKR